ncbi:MAG: RNA 2',3'-cyclic phosphodiesterase [Dehalococcoidia bacterium]|nr:RNA 2',3'-cyclic phosphodiesterase [Dehalococcoidia bacterium]
MRLFTAIDIPAAWLRAADAAAAELTRRAEPGLRMSAPGNTHLTVRFLGEVEDDDVPALVAALAQLRATPCELRLSAAGTFGSAARTRVVWLGVDGDQSCLDRLVGALDTVLAEAGLEPDQSAWRPHLTLARVRDRTGAEERRALAELVGTLPAPAGEPFVADCLALYRSHRGSGPAHYELLTSVRFG